MMMNDNTNPTTENAPPLDQFKRPLQDLRISVTDRCNFRCGYCMPEEIFGERYQFLKRDKLLTFEEITRVARIIADMVGGVKLRLTGGEPLMRHELEKLVVQLSALDHVHDIAMTTNAYFLPQKAEALKQAGLRRITVSLDSLDDTVFKAMNGNRSSVAEVLAGIEAAQKAGFDNIKINCVVKRGVNDHTLVDMAKFCKERGYILRFIEFMDVGTRNGWELKHVVGAKEIIEKINAALPLKPIDANYFGETALRYQYADGQGELGVIASVTKPFCGSCTRLRLSPEGQIFTCLFANKGTDLRDPIRSGASDDDIKAIIGGTWHKRTDRYSDIRTEETAKGGDKIEMYYIGG